MLCTATLIVALWGCADSTRSPVAPPVYWQLEADAAPRFSDWSVPVNVGAPVNSPSFEQGESLSKDGLRLYFASSRPGGLGDADMYVSRRSCTDLDRAECAWQVPVNLGPTVNTTGFEAAPRLSIDGHWLYFTSTRPGGFGGQDLYVSRRRDKKDDLAWEAPVNLGPGINTAGDEGTSDIFDDEATGTSELYYSSGPANSAGVDIYLSTLGPDGAYGPGVPVAELNTDFLERMPAIARGGLEMFFASSRPGGSGALDLWVATRSSTSAPWSTPVNLGSTVNSSVIDARPAISFDGTQLYFQSPRSGGLGGFDLFVTTRDKLKGSD
jgi:Tol biopolymer transport system component